MDLYYEVQGEGTPIVLLHSGGEDLRDWYVVAHALRVSGYQSIGHSRFTALGVWICTTERLGNFRHISTEKRPREPGKEEQACFVLVISPKSPRFLAAC